MSKYQKIIWLIILLVSVLFVTLLTYNLIEADKIKKINQSYDNRLVDIRICQETALKYLNVLKIKDDQSYQDVKNQLNSYLSGELQQELFATEKYNFTDTERIRYEVIDVKASIYNGHYLYKVDVKVKGDVIKDILLLIGVKNNKIISVEKL